MSEDNNPWIGAYGDRLARTPNLDALARRGLLYRHAWSAAPVCAPSRFAILTGVHPESCAPANHMRAVARLGGALRTYPELLRDAGYYCTNNAKTDYFSREPAPGRLASGRRRASRRDKNCDVDPAAIWSESSDQGALAKPSRGRSVHGGVQPLVRPPMPMVVTLPTASSPAPSLTAEPCSVPAYLPDTPEIRAGLRRQRSLQLDTCSAWTPHGRRYDFVRAASDGRFHYIRNYTPHRVFQHGAFEWLAKGYQSWEREYLAGRLDAVQLRFFAGKRPFEELYDLYRDPDQVRNLAAEPAMARQLDAMRRELDSHLLAINDNGFIPEGMEIEGWRQSRDRAAYPLERVMELAASAAARDPAKLESLIRQLDDANAVIRHWAILGILMLGEAGLEARDRLAGAMRDDPVPQNRVAAAEAVARIAPSPEAVAILAVCSIRRRWCRFDSRRSMRSRSSASRRGPRWPRSSARRRASRSSCAVRAAT